MTTFKNNGKLKLLIIVGTRLSINVGNILMWFWLIQGRTMITT